MSIDLVAWCRRESVKGGGRDVLNGVWEQHRKLRSRLPLSACLFTWLAKSASAFCVREILLPLSDKDAVALTLANHSQQNTGVPEIAFQKTVLNNWRTSFTMAISYSV